MVLPVTQVLWYFYGHNCCAYQNVVVKVLLTVVYHIWPYIFLIRYDTLYYDNNYGKNWVWALQWHHNEHHDISNHRHLDCLLSVFSGLHLRKHQSSVSMDFARGIHRLSYWHGLTLIPAWIRYHTITRPVGYGMKSPHFTHFPGCNNFSMVGFKLKHVTMLVKWAPGILDLIVYLILIQPLRSTIHHVNFRSLWYYHSTTNHNKIVCKLHRNSHTPMGKLVTLGVKSLYYTAYVLQGNIFGLRESLITLKSIAGFAASQLQRIIWFSQLTYNFSELRPEPNGRHFKDIIKFIFVRSLITNVSFKVMHRCV